MEVEASWFSAKAIGQLIRRGDSGQKPPSVSVEETILDHPAGQSSQTYRHGNQQIDTHKKRFKVLESLDYNPNICI